MRNNISASEGAVMTSVALIFYKYLVLISDLLVWLYMLLVLPLRSVGFCPCLNYKQAHWFLWATDPVNDIHRGSAQTHQKIFCFNRSK